MKDLTETQQRLLKLKGETLGIECMLNALLHAMPPDQLAATLREFDVETEGATVELLNHGRTSDHVIDGLNAYAHRVSSRMARRPGSSSSTPQWWRNP